MRQAAAPVRLAALMLATAAGVVLCVPPADGAELPFPSHQLVADRGAFLPFASPPAQPVGACIIDSGVDLNPDTQPVVVDREALDGGNPEDVSPELHGTRMAMEAAAVPGNDWGMVGAAPGAVRIVSIRATNTEDDLTFQAYKQGILACELKAPTYNIKIISLSIGFPSVPTPEQQSELQDAVVDARARFGIDVLAAAGDEGATQIAYPAGAPGVLAVGASNAQRERCPFSNVGPQLALLAPGCDLDEANPLTGEAEYDLAGDSFSEAAVAAVLGALRAYRPELTGEQAEELLKQTATAAGGVLDVTALFQAAGLGSVVANGEAHEPTPTPPVTSTLPSITSPPPVSRPARLARPRVLIHRHGKTIIVGLLNLPRGDRVTLTLLGRRRDGHRRRVRQVFSTRRTIALPAVGGGLLVVSFSDPQGHALPSSASYKVSK
jgi:membrane-anchored mycosin MYCP